MNKKLKKALLRTLTIIEFFKVRRYAKRDGTIPYLNNYSGDECLNVTFTHTWNRTKEGRSYWCDVAERTKPPYENLLTLLAKWLIINIPFL